MQEIQSQHAGNRNGSLGAVVFEMSRYVEWVSPYAPQPIDHHETAAFKNPPRFGRAKVRR